MGLCVSTLIGRLLQHVLPGLRDLWQQQQQPQLKKKDLLRAKRELSALRSSNLRIGDLGDGVDRACRPWLEAVSSPAMNRDLLSDDPGMSLPDDILEDIFLRLPFFDLCSVKRVCRTWKRVIASQSFRRSYKSTATLVEANYSRLIYEMEADEVLDSNKACRVTSKFRLHRTITSHINGLVIAKTKGIYYVGNMFANTLERVPFPYSRADIGNETAIFHLGGGQYRLVYWREGLILTRTIWGGKQKWCEAYSTDRRLFYTNPVVIGSSMFRMRVEDNFLVEYNHAADKVQSTRITSTQAEVLEGVEELFFEALYNSYYLIVWQDKLYLLKQHGYRADSRVDVWQISTADGRATFLHMFKIGKEVEFDIFDVDNEGVLHLEGTLLDIKSLYYNDTVSLSYDMVGKCMRNFKVVSFTKPHDISRHTLLPVRLSCD